MRAFAGAPGTRGFRVLGWESAGEIPSEVEGALHIPRIRPSPMRFQGILSITLSFLDNLFVDNEIAGVGRTPWRGVGERYGVGILRLALSFASSGSCSLRKTEGYSIQPN